MSQLKVNSIVDAAGGSSAVLYGVASPPNSMGFRNRLINSDMRIDQRNAGASVTPASNGPAYLLDRFAYYNSQVSKLTYQQNAGGVTPPAGFSNYLGVTVASAATVGSSDVFLLYQPIEGFNVSDLAWGTANAQSITISFWVRSSLTGNFSGALQNSGNTRTYAFPYSISQANTWERKTVTVNGDTAGTWLTNNGTGITINFSLGTGSSLSTTAGSWVAGNTPNATGSVNLVATAGATFYITGVQLEAGSVATPFERRDYGRELMMCQRYYEKSFPLGVVPSNGASATTLSTDSGSVTGLAQNRLNTGPTVFFKVTKRATPTMQKFGNNSGDWVYALQSSTSWLAGASTGLGRISDSSFMADQQAQDSIAIYLMGHWTASAEL